MFVSIVDGAIWVQLEKGDPTQMGESFVIGSEGHGKFAEARRELINAVMQVDALEAKEKYFHDPV